MPQFTSRQVLSALFLLASLALCVWLLQQDRRPPTVRNLSAAHRGQIAQIASQPADVAQAAALPNLPSINLQPNARSILSYDTSAGLPPNAPRSNSPTYPGVSSNSIRHAANGKPPKILSHPLYPTLVEGRCNVSTTNIKALVARQLAPWMTPGPNGEPPPRITLDVLDSIYCVRRHVVRISYHNGELRYTHWQLGMDHHRVTQSLWFFALVALRAQQRGQPLPNFELMLNPNDHTVFEARGTSKPPIAPEPLFCNVKCDGDTSISFPIMFHAQLGHKKGYMSLDLYNSKYQALDELGQSKPLTVKRRQAFFSATNARGHRAALYNLTSPYLAVLNAVVPLAINADYRGLIYAYGFSGWSQRLRELAFMNSIIMAEDSKCREFYHDYFVKGVDYVSVAEDFSDVEHKAEQVMQMTDEDAVAMASRWRQKGRAILALPCVLNYAEELMREYATRQDFVPQPHPDWVLYEIDQDFVPYPVQMPRFQDCHAYL